MSQEIPEKNQGVGAPKEKQNTALLNPNNKPLTDQEKADLLRDYEATKKRIDLAQKKILHCRDVLNQLPVGHEAQKKGQAAYEQAKVLFDGIMASMPAIEGPMRSEEPHSLGTKLEGMRSTLYDIKRSKYEEVLQKNNIDASKVMDVLFPAEQEAEKVLEMVHQLRALGLKEDQIKEIFSIRPKLRFENLIPFFQETIEKMALTPKDALDIWKDDSLYGKKPELQTILSRIRWLVGLRIQVRVYNFLKALKMMTLSDDVFEGAVKGFAELDFTQSELEMVMTVDCDLTRKLGYKSLQNYIALAKKEAVSFDDAFTLWQMLKAGDDPQEILMSLKKDNLITQIQPGYEIFSENSGNRESGPEYDFAERVIRLASMKNVLSGGDILEIAKSDDDITQTRAYILTLLKQTNLTWMEIRLLRMMEKDEKVLLEYWNTMRSVVFEYGDMFTFLQVERNPKKAGEYLKASQVYVNQGFPRIAAFGMAKAVDGYHHMSRFGMDNTQDTIDGFAMELRTKGGATPSEAAVLWRLFPNNIEAAKRYSSAAIVKSGVTTGLHFIDVFEKAGIPKTNAITWFEVNSSPEEALRAMNMFSEISNIYAAKLGIVNPTTSDPKQNNNENAENITKFTDFYMSQGVEMRSFIRYILSRTAKATIENLKGFIADPTLPMSLDVYRKLGNGDVALALKIGRNLYYQNYKAAPEKTELEAKMKELETLQQSSDAIKIFDGRNIIYVANNEQYDDGTLRFNSPEIRNAIKESAGEHGTIAFEAVPVVKPTAGELHELKKSIIEKLISTPPPMTFFFNGHGGPGKLYMYQGEIVENSINDREMGYITMEEVADAIQKRTKKYNGAELSKDIFIFGACYNHDSIRKLYELCKKNDAIAPILMGNSEYGMYGFQYGNAADVDRALLQIGKRGTTIGDVRQNEKKYIYSDYTIYVSNAAGQPQQIVENKPAAIEQKKKKGA